MRTFLLFFMFFILIFKKIPLNLSNFNDSKFYHFPLIILVWQNKTLQLVMNRTGPCLVSMAKTMVAPSVRTMDRDSDRNVHWINWGTLKNYEMWKRTDSSLIPLPLNTPVPFFHLHWGPFYILNKLHFIMSCHTQKN